MLGGEEKKHLLSATNGGSWKTNTAHLSQSFTIQTCEGTHEDNPEVKMTKVNIRIDNVCDAMH